MEWEGEGLRAVRPVGWVGKKEVPLLSSDLALPVRSFDQVLILSDLVSINALKIS